MIVEIADRGPGLTPGEERAVFLKFHRGDPSPSARGTGLGLAICAGIIRAHGGRIWAENRSGGGVAIRFTLPVKGAPPTALTDPADGA
jgi:two-component system sensor histidine kinase KdpD